MSTEPVPAGSRRPPLQARSRAALQRILAAAESVLATDGFDDFTMNEVAARAEVSVGSLYRRFVGKEELLDAVKERMLSQLEHDVDVAVGAAAGQGLTAVVDAYVTALGAAFSAGSQVYPQLLVHASAGRSARGARAYAAIERSFLDAASPHLGEVRRSDPTAALTLVSRMIVATCVQRTLVFAQQPGEPSWAWWRAEILGMATAYLASGPA